MAEKIEKKKVFKIHDFTEKSQDVTNDHKKRIVTGSEIKK
jgi:hypothetical protein